MFRKLTLITMAVVLGLAVFAGCSNDAITTSSGTGEERTTKWIEGKVSDSSGEPIPEAYIYILKNGNPTLWSDYSDKKGDYRIDMGTNPGNGDYTAICIKDPTSFPQEKQEYDWTWPGASWHITHNFNFM